jgi:glycosyltransferase involved in cell wall biosynthesis
MLNRIIRKIVPQNNKVLLQEKIEELEKLRKQTSEIAIYGSPTEGNWLGVANASISLFPKYSYEFPQWYSHPVFKDKELAIWINKLNELNFEKITISGFAFFFFEIINRLTPNSNLEVIYHGTWSEMHERDKQVWMKNLFDNTRIGKIKKIGFVKTGMAETVEKLFGFSCFHSPLPPPIIPNGIQKLELDRTKIHIGVFGADTFNKNLHNQVVHALLIENSIIHVLDKSIFTYLNMDHRIIEHGKNLPKEIFLGILASMDLNLYMSYSESWGLVAYESEAMGIETIGINEIDYFQIISTKLG